ncbi:MAG: hypothetical protein ACRCVT_11670 [Leadbetterella sp.]
MKRIKLTTLIFGLLLFGCKQADDKTASLSGEKALNSADDKEQIQNLIRKVYEWHEGQNPSNNDMITDRIDSIYIGFNIDQLKLDVEELKATNFFSTGFIDNYYRIYTTLNEKLRNKEIEWLVGDLPPFGNDANPWCNCQDNPDNYWQTMTVDKIAFNSNVATFTWTWGDNFHYKASAIKLNGSWKISYLEGFNFDEFTRKNY